MKPSPIRKRLLVGGGIVTLSVAVLFAPAAAADSRSSEGQVLLWLLGLRMAQGSELRIDVNSATLEELRTVPGLARHQAVRIIAERPYERLQELARADLSPVLIERLAPFLVTNPVGPSALPAAARSPRSR